MTAGSTPTASCGRCQAAYFACCRCGEGTCCDCNSTYVDANGRLSSVSQLLAGGISPEGNRAHFDCVQL